MTIPDNDARITNKNKTIIERRGEREREREVCIISSSIAGRPEIRSIMLSIRDSNDSATRLRADALAFVHEFGRRVVQGRSFSPTPLEFDSRGIKGIKGEEERKKWGLVEGDTDDDPSFCFILETEGEGESKDRARSVQRYKGEGGSFPSKRRVETPPPPRCLMFYARIYMYIYPRPTWREPPTPNAVIFITLLPPCYRLNGY